VPAGGYSYGLASVGWATVLQADPDPAIVTDPALRAAIVATTLPWHVRDNQTQMEMMLIPPGTYEMGCTPSAQHGCLSNESPVHTVTISRPFYLGRYEVTQTQWTAMMGANPSFHPEPNGPVENVSFDTVQGYLSATGMRLPTEAEWEYACRAGTTTAFHGWPAVPAGTNDESLVGNIGWVNYEEFNPQPVGGKAPNGFGLSDMVGNVDEFASDWYGTYPTAAQTDPTGPATGSTKVVRGSDTITPQPLCRVSYRSSEVASYADIRVGFRVVREALAPSISGVSTEYLVPGMSFEVSGEHLGATTSVTVDGIAASFKALGSGTLLVVAPDHAWGGPFNLRVTTPEGIAEGGADNAVYYCSVPSWATVIGVEPDPEVVTDAGIRAAIIATGHPWHVRANTAAGIEMMLIPPGSFQMGCSASNQHGCDGDENPVHTVTLTKPFYIGRSELTQDQWNTVPVYRNAPYFDTDAGYSNTGSWPAESVTWETICEGDLGHESWLYLASTSLSAQFRLPTEAEWEYAYRAGTTTAYHGYPGLPGGSNDGSDSYVALISWCGAQTQPQAVALKSPNGFGLYDMGGNVAEWCWDWMGGYPSSGKTDPTGATSGTQRVVRNGGYSDDWKYCRSSSRSGRDPSSSDDKTVGLRVVLDP
jgi:formylglycine-generating enzyme required for sulfatase activity